jgi:Fe2+ transport system protein FeoA
MQQKDDVDNISTESEDIEHIDITQLSNGTSAKVVELDENNEITSKLEAMGIIPGAIITKKSAIISKGPIIIEKDFIQFAIGYDTAQKIIVEPLDGECI